MAARGYSRFITWVKIILPVLALAMLSSLVLFSKKIDPEMAIPFADTDVEDLAQNQRVGSPTFSTVTARGSAITISALSVLPDANSPDIVFAEFVTARIEGGAVDWIQLTAENAAINTAEQQASFTGAVEIETAQEYRVMTETLNTRLDIVDLSAPGDISIKGANFALSAGSMRLSEIEKSGENHLLVFKQGVKLVYQP